MRQKMLARFVGMVGMLSTGTSLPLGAQVHGQSAPQYLSRDAVLADLDTLQAWVLAIHPQPHAHADPKTVAAAHASVRAAWNQDSVTAISAAQGMTRFLRTFQDAHTTLHLPKLLEMYRSDWGQLPWEVRFVEGQTIVQNDPTGTLPAGAELRSVRGQGASVARQWALSLAPVEGVAPEAAALRADRLWNDVAGWAYGLPPGTQVPVVAMWQGQRLEREVTVVARNPPSRRTQRKRERRALAWSLGADGGPATLTVTHFPYASPPFERRLNRFLRACSRRDISGVVLDLRNNPGGSVRTMQALRAGLGGDSVVWPSGVQIRQTPEGWAQTEWARKPRAMRRSLRQLPEDEWAAFTQGLAYTPPGALLAMEFRKPMPRARHAFDGYLAVLIDGSTASAATTLAAWLKQRDLTYLFGSPALGSALGSYGNGVVRHLPRTGWPVMISTAVYYNHAPGPVLQPLEPHRYTAPTRADWEAGRDAVLEEAIDLLNRIQAAQDGE